MVKQGDIIRLNFDPQAGHEQSGRRPAIVVSNIKFNRFSHCKQVMVCPITRTDKNLPYHIRLDDRTKTNGVILTDQLRALDINAREYEFIEEAPEDIIIELIDVITGFIEITC